jgi:hypothetical protein
MEHELMAISAETLVIQAVLTNVLFEAGERDRARF